MILQSLNTQLLTMIMGTTFRGHSVSTLKGLSSLLHRRAASLEREISNAEFERNCCLGVQDQSQEQEQDQTVNDEFCSDDELDMLGEFEMNEENRELAEWLKSVWYV